METLEYKFSEEQLLTAGYNKTWYPSYRVTKPLASALFQKCIRDEKGKKYFIDIWMYDNRDVRVERPYYGWSPEVHTTLASGLPLVTQVIIGLDDTLEQVEAAFEDIFIKLGCKYYEED